MPADNPKSSQTTFRNHGWVFDKTLNIPTILTVVLMFVSGTAFTVRQYNHLDQGVREADRKAELAREGVRRVESVQAAQAQNNAAAMSSLRNEIRGDLRDVNSKLDRLLFDRAGVRSETKDWTR